MDFLGKKNNTFNDDSLLPPLTVLVFIMLLIFLCAFIGLAFIFGVSQITGMDMATTLEQIEINNSPSLRNHLRSILAINHLSMFVLPGFLFGFILYKQAKVKYFQLNKLPLSYNIFLGVFLILCSFPLAQFTMWANMQIPLPDWMLQLEENTANLVNGLLKTEEPYELFFNIFVIALIPAIGEELIFRGILQRQLIRLFKNPIIGIWVGAIIFSAFHMQFEGFLPRMLLGALLGYLLYWTKNLWIPIIAHFFYNGSQIVAQYFYADQFADIDLENASQISWSGTIISTILIFIISYYIIQFNQSKEQRQV